MHIYQRTEEFSLKEVILAKCKEMVEKQDGEEKEKSIPLSLGQLSDMLSSWTWKKPGEKFVVHSFSTKALDEAIKQLLKDGRMEVGICCEKACDGNVVMFRFFPFREPIA